MPVIFGKNAILEALKTRQSLEKIYIHAKKKGGTINLICKLAREQKIPIVQADLKKLEQMSQGEKHQGVLALISPIKFQALEDLVEKIQYSGKIGNLLIIDKIQDPHNLGAIVRSAEVLGCDGIILSTRDTVPLTDVVVKASAGAIFHMAICKVNNIRQAVKYLKDCGFWIYSSSPRGEKQLWEMDFYRNLAVIIGSEERGVSISLLNESDETFRIPQKGKTDSLNASVAPL